MSLHAAAQHLAAHGRGRDTQLVHMSPTEVKSLQDLARAHGGSLTTNPKTGLPEAGFLEAALPMAAGFALNAAFPGLGALGSAALVGGASYLTSGSLTKGLMAGLGAYGGAGLGEGVNLSSAAGSTSESAGNLLNQAPVSDAVPKYIGQPAAIRPEYVDVATGASTSPVSLGSVTGTPITTPAIPTPEPGPGYLDSNAGMAEAYNNAQNVATSAGKNLAYNPDYGYGPNAVSLGGAGNTATTATPASLGKEMTNWDIIKKNATMKNLGMAAAPLIGEALTPKPLQPLTTASTPNPVYAYNRGTATPMPTPDQYGVEQNYFPDAGYTRVAAKGGSISAYAEGGATPYIQGSPAQGSVEHMSNENAVGANTGYPQAGISQGAYATPWQTPISRNVLEGAADTGVNPISGEMNFANGGLSNLGGYSDGGRLLRGPGDGVSDSIPAVIGKKQPARLADGEFVVPARIVSEIGNGSTEAGARKLYAMMDRVQQARGKTVGKGKVAKNTRADKYLPA